MVNETKDPAVIDRLEKLGFKAASAEVKLLATRKRKMALAYELYRFVRPERINDFNARLKMQTRKQNGGYQVLDFQPIEHYKTVPPADVLNALEIAQAVEFHIKNTLDEESIDHENVWPYLKAFQTFESTEGYCVKHTEIPLYSRKYGFAGTLDHLAEFEDRRFLGEGIADLKVTERSDKAADIQLCLYAELYYENYGKWPAFRMILELHGDKTAKPIFYTANPRKICNAIMRLYEWKITKPEKRLLHAAV
jgi:hypothetical protein